ncbi:MAG: LPS-assembly protein LptD [Deltaproteobacteria bacterium]|nr:LPS-assembly protein LptD [Deltaproteobacteria bacterium]MBW2444660.1 LPS-assembly protein LptD [Deltaproteobacteria bacterium]
MRRASGSGEVFPFIITILLSTVVWLAAWPTGTAAAQTVAEVLAASEAAEAEAKAQAEPPFKITADSIEYDSAKSVYVGRGNVRIQEGRQLLTADWVMFSNVTRQGLASGHVVHQDGPDRLTGEFLQFNIDTLKGFVRQGLLTSDESRFEMRAMEIRKTGEETYTFQKGRFTTCECPDGGDPSWELVAEETNLTVDGYAVAKNAKFEMFGLPILWSPWAAYPLKRERSSGLLFPQFNSTNRSGLDVGVPFYWAARHDLNITLTPQYLQKRGFKGAANAEWVRPSGTSGEFFFTIISDDEITGDDPQQPIDELRWAVDSKQIWELPGDVTAKVDANLIRDNLFLRDFRDMREFGTFRFMESVAFAERDLFETGWVQWNTAAYFADDLQNPDDVDRDDALVQRLPETSVRVLSKPVARVGPVNVVGAFDASHSYYWSRDKASDRYPGLVVGDDLFVDTGIDGIPSSQEQDGSGNVTSPDQDGDDFATTGGYEGDGIFQEGELLGDRGHKIDLYPRLSLPFRLLDQVEVVPEVGYRSTLYSTDAQGFEERGMVTGRLDLRTRLRRSYEGGFLARPVSHILEPFFSWAIVQDTGQGGNPLFVPATALPQERIRMLDLGNVTGDRADRVDRFNGFTFGVRNELIGRSLAAIEDPETGEIEYRSDQSRLVADITMAYSYEIWDNRLGNLVAEGNWWPWSNWVTNFHVNFDPSRVTVDEGLLGFSYWSEAGHNVSINYRYVDEIPEFFEEFRSDRDRLDDFDEDFNRVNQLIVNGRFAFTRQWAATYAVGYAFEQSIFLRNQGGIEYTSKCLCWALRVEGNYRRQSGFDVGVRYTLLGLGDDPVRPFSRGGRLSIQR